jgi:hypothetical protein
MLTGIPNLKGTDSFFAKAKVGSKKLSPEMVANLLDAADLIQAKFDECPELKDLYYDQFSQLLDTAVKNSVIST